MKVGIAMLITLTNNINYNAVSNEGIYTRDRQMEHRYNLRNKEKTKPISQNSLLAIIILVALMLFSLCVGMIYFKSVISQVQMNINDINSEIRTIEQKNSRLQADKIGAIDIDYIRISAEKMGMSLPQTYQIEYVETIGGETTKLNLTD